MARQKGSYTLAGNYEIEKAGALDCRLVVDTIEDLIKKDTWPKSGDIMFLYNGMIVSVTEDGSVWELIDKSKYDTTDYSGWRRIDSPYRNIKYSELVALRNSCALIPGMKYCITDYETIVKDSTNYSVNKDFKNSFNVVVTAISENTLSEDAEASFTPYHLAANPSSLIDINGWKDCNPDTGREFPADFPGNMGHGYVSNTGLRPGLVLRIKYLGTTSLGTPTKGWGADLTVNGSSKVLAATFTPGSYDTADEGGYFYLKVPQGINPKTSYSVHFFAEFKAALTELNSGACGIEIMVTNPSISSWKLKYCLDNDTNRFEWANKEAGKGVIYYMKDEYDNEAPYDFKNILFNGLYTFHFEVDSNTMYDGSVFNSSECFNNTIKPYNVNAGNNGQLTLNNIVFIDANQPCYNNYFEENCRNIALNNSCYNNRFIFNTFNSFYDAIQDCNFYHRPASKNEFGGITTVSDPYIGAAYLDQGWSNGIESNGVNVSAKNGKLCALHTDSKYHAAFTYIPYATTDDVGLMQIGTNMLEDDLFLLSDGVLKKGPGFEKLGQNESVISSLIQKITYQDLYTLRQHDNLIPGMKYRITDYETTVNNNINLNSPHTVSVVSNQGQTNKFDIIVEAINSHELSEIAQVCHSHENLNNDKKGSEYTTQDASLGNFREAYDETTAIPLELQNKYKDRSIYQQKWTRTTDTVKWNNWIENGDIRIGIKFDGSEASFDQVLSIVGIDFISAKKDKVTGDIVTKVLAADYEMTTIWAEPNSIVYKYLFNPIEKIEASDDNYEVTLQLRIFALADSINVSMTDESLILYVEPYTPYFHNCCLNSWEIKYCLDNDTKRFEWAKEDGKGVIYYMKDNNGNEAPYDFKNILFNNRYTFHNTDGNGNYVDGSVLSSRFKNNIIKPIFYYYTSRPVDQMLNNVILDGTDAATLTNNIIEAANTVVRGSNNNINLIFASETVLASSFGRYYNSDERYPDYYVFEFNGFNSGEDVHLTNNLLNLSHQHEFNNLLISKDKWVYIIPLNISVYDLPYFNRFQQGGEDLRTFFAKGYNNRTGVSSSITYQRRSPNINLLDVDLMTIGSDNKLYTHYCQLWDGMVC